MDDQGDLSHERRRPSRMAHWHNRKARSPVMAPKPLQRSARGTSRAPKPDNRSRKTRRDAQSAWWHPTNAHR